MLDTLLKENYTLRFIANANGTAGIEPFRNGKPIHEPMDKILFAPGQPLSIEAVGPDQPVTSIASVTIDFTALKADAQSPIGDGTNPQLVWYPGTAPVQIGLMPGTWTFTATLTEVGGRAHRMPDPEFHVGDGGVDL